MLHTAFTSAGIFIPTVLLMRWFFSKPKWDPKGKHCYVTGGSSGLGLSVALLLAQRGAHVSILARNQERLDQALQQLEANRQTPLQIFAAYAFAADNARDAVESLEASTIPHSGRCPDAFFLCAGASHPGYFVEQTEDQMNQGIQETYWTQAWSAWAASKRMVHDGVKGKIVFVSSLLGYFSMIGYSPYSPGKFAIRGLAEALQSEFLMYGIDVHILYPGRIFSPGLVETNKVKPQITVKLEETDAGLQPDKIAEYLLDGVARGKFHITYGFIGRAFRTSSRGASPGNSGLVDQIYAFIAALGFPLWRKAVDRQVRGHRDEHFLYLKSKGLVRGDVEP